VTGGAAVGPATPADPDAERRVAEEAIRRANKAMEKEQYWDAIQLLEPAIDALSGRAHVRARVILATAYLKNPKWVKRGEEVFQTVIRDDPQNVDALLALARIYKAQGMRTRSVSMFRKVLQAQPDNEEAKAEAPPEPSPDEPPPSGGFIKKLFGKG
jgi:Tfp pilus assembly protein PilF